MTLLQGLAYYLLEVVVELYPYQLQILQVHLHLKDLGQGSKMKVEHLQEKLKVVHGLEDLQLQMVGWLLGKLM